jgi:hypothetical protein
MLGTPEIQAALSAALAKLLRPVVRLLLRHAVPYGVFEEIAKKVYVDVALSEFAVPGRKPSMSRASILTGLTRKDVRRLLEAAPPDPNGTATQYNRAVRVLTAWTRDPALRTPAGEPMPLPVEGEPGFAALVRQHSGDMPVRAVLDELLRLGAVQMGDDGRLELLQRGYVPRQSELGKIGILGTDTAELAQTILHNIEQGQADPRYQRKVMHVGIPVDALPEFRRLSAAQSQALLEAFDAWLQARDVKHRPTPPDAGPVQTARVGVGIYYFEETTGAAQPH